MAKDLIGKSFHGLTVIKQTERPPDIKDKRRYYLCKCAYCGKEKVVSSGNIGKQKSCGCRQQKHPITHGYASHGKYDRLYHIWLGIKYRCNNPKSKDYKNYGAKGVKMCSEWADNFMAFREWALSNGYAENLTIERKDNDKGYSPDNCRWATVAEQNKNKRKKYERKNK